LLLAYQASGSSHFQREKFFIVLLQSYLNKVGIAHECNRLKQSARSPFLPSPLQILSQSNIYQFFLLPRFAIRFNQPLSEFIASPNTEVEYWFLLKPEKSRLSV
jgi:hypothetical protein